MFTSFANFSLSLFSRSNHKRLTAWQRMSGNVPVECMSPSPFIAAFLAVQLMREDVGPQINPDVAEKFEVEAQAEVEAESKPSINELTSSLDSKVDISHKTEEQGHEEENFEKLGDSVGQIDDCDEFEIPDALVARITITEMYNPHVSVHVNDGIEVRHRRTHSNLEEYQNQESGDDAQTSKILLDE